MLSIRLSIYCLILICIFASVSGRKKSRHPEESKESRHKPSPHKTKPSSSSHHSKSKSKSSSKESQELDHAKQPSDDEIVEELREKWSTYQSRSKSGRGIQTGHASNAGPSNKEILKALELHGITYKPDPGYSSNRDKKKADAKAITNAELLIALRDDRIKIRLSSASSKKSNKQDHSLGKSHHSTTESSKERGAKHSQETTHHTTESSKELGAKNSQETSHHTTESSKEASHHTKESSKDHEPQPHQIVDELRKQVKKKLKQLSFRKDKKRPRGRGRGFVSRKRKSNEDDQGETQDEEMHDYLAKHFGSSKDAYRKWDDTLASHQNGPQKPKPIWDD